MNPGVGEPLARIDAEPATVRKARRFQYIRTEGAGKRVSKGRPAPGLFATSRDRLMS
jgi:hypothetical protein